MARHLAFAGVRRALGPHLVQRGAEAQWDFFHAQLREAVLVRNLPEAAQRQALHGQIADHLARLSRSDPVRVAELMVHQIGIRDRLRAGRYYAGLARGGDELRGATRAVAEHVVAGLAEDDNPRLGWILSLAEEPGLEADERAELCNHYHFELLDALGNDAPLGTRLAVVKRTSEVLRKLCAEFPGNASWPRHFPLSVAIGK